MVSAKATAMGRVRLGLAAACVLLASCSRAPERTPAEQYAAGELPVPPMQHASWSPPKTNVPAAAVDAVRKLFDQGLADPRGCEYRAVTVRVGSVWGGISEVETHGWMLPEGRPDIPVGQPPKGGQAGMPVPPRFAVCWDGMVYPAESVGAAADVQEDIEQAIAEGQKRRARGGSGPVFRARLTSVPFMGTNEGFRVVVPSGASFCLMMRLGEGASAERAWALVKDSVCAGGQPAPRPSFWRRFFSAKARAPVLDPDDPYLGIATDWAWALFDRAICAHMHGDDEQALADARMLSRVGPAIEAEAPRRGYTLRANSANSTEGEHFIDFLYPVDRLLADQERRAKDAGAAAARVAQPPSAAKTKDTGGGACATSAALRLIRSLEDVDARQWGQPGGVSFSMDPRVRALIREGDNAVLPLLDCLESDTRLTRSVSFWRDFGRDRALHGVDDPARAALDGILRFGAFDEAAVPPRADEAVWRRAEAGAIRAWWRRHGGMPIEERMFRILDNDTARAEQWLDAARVLVKPEEEWIRVRVSPAAKDAEPRKPVGERLRARAKPSVSDLLARRVDDILAGRAKGSPSREPKRAPGPLVGTAFGLGELLGEWDPKASLPVLRRLMARADASEDRFASLTVLRVKAGDDAALGEYARWLRAGGVDGKWSSRPLLEFAERPEMKPLLAWFFLDAASVFRRADASRRHEELCSALDGCFTRFEPCRRYMLAELADNTPVATLRNVSDGNTMVTTANSSRGVGTWENDTLAAPVGPVGDWRRCDEFAMEVAGHLPGAPLMRVGRDAAHRDEDIARLADYVRRFAPHLRAARDTWGNAAAGLTPIDRVATPLDVENGLAAFALPAEMHPRVVALPLPLEAEWMTLRGFPEASNYYDVDDELHREIRFLRKGFVVQAEEAFEGGRVRRYYGFLGPSGAAKVPAEEIEFPAGQWRWDPWSPAVDVRVELDPPKDDVADMLTVSVGGPVALKLSVRNRSGLDADAPDVARALPLRLEFASPGPRSSPWIERRFLGLIRDVRGGHWQNVPAKKDTGEGFATSATSAKPLAPAEERPAGSIDVAQRFDLSRVGYYRLHVTLPGAGPKSDAAPLEFIFRIVPAEERPNG